MGGLGRTAKGRFREELRPTQARVRDALFNTLGVRVEGARVADLYAGSGSLGLEALRRGAALAVFVELDARLVAGLRRRLADGGLADRSEVRRGDVLAVVHELGNAKRMFDIILMDPPYRRQLIPATLHAVAAAGILAPRGVVVAEGHWRDWPAGSGELVCRGEARYGETMVWYFEAGGGES
jgi:16S rRNA (guanine966-N2)-methyltransferase